MIDRHIARAEESILATLRLDDADAIDDVQLAELRATLARVYQHGRDDEAQAQDEHRGIARRHGVSL